MAQIVGVVARDPITTSVDRRKLPEGSFTYFFMDFALPGGKATGYYYPSTIKPLEGRNQVGYEAAKKGDYLAYRFAIGRARSYLVEAFGLPLLTDPEAQKLLEGITSGFTRKSKYSRLISGEPAQAHDPEKAVMGFDSGRVLRIALAGSLTDDAPSGQSGLLPIQGPVHIRVPTAVSNWHFISWYRSSKYASAKKQGMSALVLPGGKQIPLSGAASGNDKGAAKDG